MAKKKGKGGRPKTSIDEGQLEALLRMKPTLDDVAAFFNCSSSKIEKFIKTKYRMSFSAFRETKAVHTRHAIVRAIVQKALKGDNTMLIWSSKNLCNWKDKQDPSLGDPVAEFHLNYNLDSE